MVFLCRSRAQAHWVLRTLTVQLTNLGLTLNGDKTKVVHVREGFDFLGFTYKEAMSRKCNRLVRVKFPRVRSLKSMRQSIKETLKKTRLGTPLVEAIILVNRKLRGWAQYFRIGNSYKAAVMLSNYACRQLRLYWRRCKHTKRIQGSQKWKNSFFYEKGLFYVPSLLWG